MVSSVKSVKGMRLAVVPLGYYGVSNKIVFQVEFIYCIVFQRWRAMTLNGVLFEAFEEL